MGILRIARVAAAVGLALVRRAPAQEAGPAYPTFGVHTWEHDRLHRVGLRLSAQAG